MAIETLYITQQTPEQTSLDYDKLYGAGIEHIQLLSGKLWTDYNAHDPGITILEILCYAITELGYRCDFEIKDLITPPPGHSGASDFFTLAQIGSNAPLTISDFRKILIDLPGIRNAWLEKAPTSESKIYLDSRNASGPLLLTYEVDGAVQIPVRGLYHVYVQFGEDPDFGDLNDNSIVATFDLEIVPNNFTLPFEAELEFPLFESFSPEFDIITDQVLLGDTFSLRLKDLEVTESDTELYVYHLVLEVNPFDRGVEIPITVRVIGGTEEVRNRDDFRNQLAGAFYDPLDAEDLLHYDPNAVLSGQAQAIQVLFKYMERRKLIRQLLDTVRASLADHRNLCEDFIDVYPMSLQEIGLTLEMEVEAGADLEDICAEVYYRTEQYLNPAIQFYTLREMLEKGYTPDDIFRGPVLSNGFLDEDELSFQQQRDTLYTSDLVQAFMAIEGVRTIRTIALSRYEEGVLKKRNAKECLHLVEPQRKLPRLNYSRSSVLLDRGTGTPLAPDATTVLEKLDERKALSHLKGIPDDKDFPIETGNYQAMNQYYSIQHEFPANYAIGYEGLAPTEPELRKGQEKQLKAYLLFFEQLLADFLSQLANLRKLFAFQEDIDRTYFTQALFQVPRVQHLIRDFTDAGDTITWEDYQDYANLGRSTHYQYALDANAESLATFNDRRKRFLDHLLARFNESFTEYASYVFSKNYAEANKYSTLIGDQVRFLRNYVGHSHDRGTAFNYRDIPVNVPPLDFWVPGRVPGLKKRITYLAGLPKEEMEYINPFDYFEVYQDGGNKYRYRLFDSPGGNNMLYAAAGYDTLDELFDVIETVLRLGVHAENFVLVSNTWRLQETVEGNTTTYGVVSSSFVTLQGSGAAAIGVISGRLYAIANIENLHIVEHVLLRPRNSSDPLLPVRIYQDCASQSIRDPYSFRISVVLPTWAGRFQEIAYRRMFKKMLRSEAPAHVYIHFHWINMREMYDFEHCWLDWLNGEWKQEDARILLENSDVENEVHNRLLQENKYFLLLERRAAAGEDGIFFVDCLADLENRYDAYYILEPPRIVDQYNDCDLLAYPVDPDGEIIKAWLGEGSVLPPGTCMHPCTGAIRVENKALLQDVLEGYPLTVITLNIGGEATTHDIVIRFIPNGPAIVSYGPINKHIKLYGQDEIVVNFSDPDGAIIQATLISPNTMPSGFALDLISGAIRIIQPNALVAGTYSFQIKLMDEEGGVTILSPQITVIPDAPAVVEVKTPPLKNEDAYQVGDVVATIMDVDGGISDVQTRIPQAPLADYGLEVALAGLLIQFAEIRVVNVVHFRNALLSRYTLSGGFYQTTLRLKTQDFSLGESEVDVALSIRKDNLPVVSAIALKNIDSYVVGTIMCSITDELDLKLSNVSTGTVLIDRGLVLELNGGIGQVKVGDVTRFKDYMRGLYDSNPVSRTVVDFFGVDTVDNTGGLATAQAKIHAIIDQEPQAHPIVPKSSDVYAPSDILGYISDPDMGGVLRIEASPNNTVPLDAIGVTTFIGSVHGVTGSVGLLRVNDISKFRAAWSTPYFVPDGSDPNLLFTTVLMRTVDVQGGIGDTPFLIGVQMDTESVAIPVKDGQRINEYVANDVLWRIREPGTETIEAIVSQQGLPAGVQTRLNALKECDVYVVFAQALQPGNYPVTITVRDSQGDSTTLNFTIKLLPRLLQLSFFFETGGTHFLDTINQVPSLRVDRLLSTKTPSSFGTLHRSSPTAIYFHAGTGFVNSTTTAEFGFEGTMNNNTIQVEGVFLIAYRRENPIRGDIGNLRVGNVETKTLNTGKMGVASATERLLDTLSNARNYPENPLVQTNPTLVGSFFTGKKDNAVVNDLSQLLEATTNEIVRLKGVIANGNAKTEAGARQDLEATVELYQQQVLGAVMYANEVRFADLGEEDPVKDLFDKIAIQLGKIQ